MQLTEIFLSDNRNIPTTKSISNVNRELNYYTIIYLNEFESHCFI